MTYSFDDGDADERHETQYFEMLGNRGIYHKGWTAVTKHRTPWETGVVELPAFDDDVWELYDTTNGWTQSRNLAAEYPDKLHELQRLWLIEAVKYNVLPLDDRFAERANSAIAGRPELITGTSQVLYGGMGRLSESSIINYKNKLHAVTAKIVVPERADGVIVAVGGLIGGWSLYTRNGTLKYCYNFFGVERYVIEASETLAAGTHQVRMEFGYDGGGIAKGGDVTLFVDGEQVGAGRVEHTEPFIFSADETCDVGFEAGSPVIADYEADKGRFNGTVNWVQIDVDEAADDADHYITEEERYRVAIAIQ